MKRPAALAVLALLMIAACERAEQRGSDDVAIRLWVEAVDVGGLVRVAVLVSDLRWRPRNGARVVIRASPVDDPAAVLTDTAKGVGAGQYVIDSLRLDRGGAWRISARVELSESTWAELRRVIELSDLGG